MRLSFNAATSPAASTLIDREEIPLGDRGRHFSDRAHLGREVLAASRLTLSVRSRHVPVAPGTLAWPPNFPLRAHFAGDSGDLFGKRGQSIDHFIDGVGEIRDFTFHIEHKLSLQVAARDFFHHF